MNALISDVNKLVNCIKVAACICAKDGVISELEEQAIFKIVIEHYPSVKADDIELAINEFFSSNVQIEEYLALIEDRDLRNFTLSLAEKSASADGLVIKENIALQKAYLIWGGVKHHV